MHTSVWGCCEGLDVTNSGYAIRQGHPRASRGVLFSPSFFLKSASAGTGLPRCAGECHAVG